jgi:esterase/lipase superfamily enzyme
MAPHYWMITNRNLTQDGFGNEFASLSYWTCEKMADREKPTRSAWARQTPAAFRKLLRDAADAFPEIQDANLNEEQRHICLFVHGYNNTWWDAFRLYRSIADNLFAERDLGICVLYTWPSEGEPYAYLPDREHAQQAAPDLADLLVSLYDWLLQKQQDASHSNPCRAKTSLIAHSMGNFVLQKAMRAAWTRRNQPLLVSLLNQLVMVAADVDNDLFKSGGTCQRL